MIGDEGAGAGHSDFIREVIQDDLRTGKHDGRVVTRFPPEPNGYLHIGHAKSICLNFGVAEEYGGHCNLRFDDTNPLTEGVEYVDSIVADVKWLGFSFGDRAFYASDYFDEMYHLAEELITEGKAYVDHLSDEEIKDYRGSLAEPGARRRTGNGRKKKIWPCSGRCGPGIYQTGVAFSEPRSISMRPT